ncbi:SsgA family sporulation/cell division regulator [Streptomyces agglomeratus]|uniref:SsgA family sporulation/cell division regulator n=1 Tax=Streptomyces agglomeratus TaxID=285458 RepID=UPI00099F8A1E|nr:SsgA family sporulation/cell division regulator [Streptomyces agglomeratus]
MSDAGSTAPPPCRELSWKTVICQVTDECPVTLDTTFRYRSDDPFTVRIDFHLPLGPTVVWHLDRDMLMAGTQSPTGIGDIHLRPAPGPGNTDRVLMRLSSPEGIAMVDVDRVPLTEWLGETYVLVPAGTESGHLDWKPFHDALAS